MSVARAVWNRLPTPLKDLARQGRNAVMITRVRTKHVTGFAAEAAEHVLRHQEAKVPSPVTDTIRYPGQTAAPADPGATYAVLSMLKNRSDDLNRLRSALSDETSLDVMKGLLAYRAFGPANVALPGISAYQAKMLAVQGLKIGPAARPFPPLETARYRMPGDDGQPVLVDCWEINAIYTFLERQYFFSRNGVTISPRTGDVVLDGGACFGDTALLFASTVGPTGHIHSFEPLPRQGDVFNSNVALNPHLAARITLHPRALDNISDRELTFTDGGAGARASSNGSVRVTTVSIDDFVQQNALPRVDFIKMDIEGSETAAVHGAAQTIRRFRPRLAISIYHSLEDLIALPLLLSELAQGYEFYIQHHTIHSEETILYGRPR